MSVNLRMLRRIDQSEEVEAADGAVGGDRQIRCDIPIIALRWDVIAIDTLHQLPLNEKLFVMEVLWDDLSQTEAELPVPQWHRDVLDERESEIAAGTAKFIDWEVAKQEILAAVK
jgi:Putative addiction module component